MSAIEMRSYVVSGLVEEATVNALLAFGEPMVTETVIGRTYANPNVRTVREYRAWMRLRVGPREDLAWAARVGRGGRVFGPWDLTPQFAAERLLRKLRGER